ncbi:DUF4870 domain-containing protein [Sporosarcina sp. FSL K6-3457]|uniref:DUF4870 domain-containing protein n=1 Tax=Sporosarcina sp. FSL K6-3457 TaxID=2978204 RepID=UPI0030FA1FAA
MSDPNSKKQTIFKEEDGGNVGREKGTPVNEASGLAENLAGALCYVAGAITGIVFLITEKENHFVRFHAWQSIITSITFFILSIILSFIPIIGWILSLLLSPIVFVLWLFLMWKAYQGEKFKLPIIGEIAEKQLHQ